MLDNSFLNINSREINQVIQKIVPECNCYSKKQYICLQKVCKIKQPVCIQCNNEITGRHFLHDMNKVYLLHMNKVTNIEIVNKKYKEVIEYIKNKIKDFQKIIENHQRSITELQNITEELQREIQRNEKNESYVSRSKIQEFMKKKINSNQKIRIDECQRLQYWQYLKQFNFETREPNSALNKFQFLKSQSKLSEEIKKITEKQFQTFENFMKSTHMYKEISINVSNKKETIKNLYNLQGRSIQVNCSMQDTEKRFISKMIVPSNDYNQDISDLYNIRELVLRDYSDSKAKFHQKLKVLKINFREIGSYYNKKKIVVGENYPTSLKKLYFNREIQTYNMVSYDFSNLPNLYFLKIYDKEIDLQTRKMIYDKGLKNKMKVINIKPGNDENLEKHFLSFKRKLLQLQRMHKTHLCRLPNRYKMEIILCLETEFQVSNNRRKDILNAEASEEDDEK